MNKEQSFLIILLVIALALVLWMVRPYMSYILSAFILTFITYPIYHALIRYVRVHSVAAILTLLLVLVIVFVPIVYLTNETAQQTFTVINQVRNIDFDTLEFTELEETILRFTGEQIDIQQRIRSSIVSVGTFLADRTLSFIGGLYNVAIGLFMLIFMMFYLYRDGGKLVEEIKSIMPMKEEYKTRLVVSFQRVTWALLAGHFLIAAIQGGLAMALYFIFGLPNALFWGLITILAGIVPFVGAYIVFVPASIFLYLQGDIIGGTGILLGGLIIVSNIDNLIRPKFVQSRADIHPILVLLGVIGGLAVFGFIGIFIGPIIFAFLSALLDVYNKANREIEEIPAIKRTRKKKN